MTFFLPWVALHDQRDACESASACRLGRTERFSILEHLFFSLARQMQQWRGVDSDRRALDTLFGGGGIVMFYDCVAQVQLWNIMEEM